MESWVMGPKERNGVRRHNLGKGLATIVRGRRE